MAANAKQVKMDIDIKCEPQQGFEINSVSVICDEPQHDLQDHDEKTIDVKCELQQEDLQLQQDHEYDEKIIHDHVKCEPLQQPQQQGFDLDLEVKGVSVKCEPQQGLQEHEKTIDVTDEPRENVIDFKSCELQQLAFETKIPLPPGYKNGYEWSFRDKEVLLSHKKYHEDMVSYLSRLRHDGPENAGQMPPKPKGKLQALLRNKGRNNGPSISDTGVIGAVLQGYVKAHELHDYLNALTVNESLGAASLVHMTHWNPTDLDSIKETLIAGFAVLKRHNAKLLAASLDYGYFLNKAFEYFSICKIRGLAAVHGVTFQHWLSDNVGLSDSYARKLRMIARDFYEYKRLRQLGISFTEFWQRKEEIKMMLKACPSLNTFWKTC